MLENGDSITKGRKICCTSYTEICKCVMKVWDKVTGKTIANFFPEGNSNQ